MLAHIGARGTAYWNVRLLDHLFDFEEIRVHSRRRESREAFAERLRRDLGKPVIVTEDWESTVRGADIMSKLVVDDWGQCKGGMFGALRAHVDAGKLSAEILHAELGQIVAGLKNGRETPEETILFWHRGLSLSDIALGHALLDLLNAGVEPEVPLLDSLGESDLAPLAHLSLALSVPLTGKDGLALVSANAASVGLGALLVAEARQVLEALLAALALSCEGYRANLSPFQPWASRLRPAPGQTEQSAALLRLLAGGELAGNPRRLQDPLSFRCATVVQGAAQQALEQLQALIELELRSGADNPALISEEAMVLATANFDSTHLALAVEGLGLALSRLAACSAERIAKLLSPASSDLPRFLITQPGHVGMAALQRTSSALVAEIGHLANPLPAVSVPVADRVEDYAGQALAVVDKTRRLTERVLWLASIELIVAAQAVDLRGPLRLGKGARQIHETVRRHVAHLEQDRSGSVDVLALSASISNGSLSPSL